MDARFEAEQDEAGAEFGDPRRCSRHPAQMTSSPDGMFDAPCGACEYEGDLAEAYDAAHGTFAAGNEDTDR